MATKPEDELATLHASLPLADSRSFSPAQDLPRLERHANVTLVKICSLAHLREMKSAAGRAQDLADLENLPAAS